MKIVSLIPARGGSKSIPCKPLYPINGTPMIDYVITASKLSKVDETWISTEDQRIKDHVSSKWNRSNIHHRPAELAGDVSSIEEVIEHFTNQVDYDILVLLQCTSPMTLSVDINKGISMLIPRRYMYDSAMSVYGMENNDMLFWSCSGNYPTPVNYNPNNRGRRQERYNKHIVETGAFYITTREQFLQSKCRIGEKILPIHVPYWRSFEVDDIDDLTNIERLMRT